MADLLDIAPEGAVEVVKINDKRIIVRGLHGDEIASIVARFPEIHQLMNGGGSFGRRLFEQAGKAIGPIIAAGVGHLGDEQQEQIAAKLLVEHQVKLLKAIIGLTFPNGIGSFVTELTALMAGPDEGARKPIKLRLRKSPSTSQVSSDMDSNQIVQ